MSHLKFLFVCILLIAAGCAPIPSTPASTLSLVWTTQTDGAINQTPLIVGDTVLLAPSASPLLALDLETGSPKWTFSPPEGIWERAYASDGQRASSSV